MRKDKSGNSHRVGAAAWEQLKWQHKPNWNTETSRSSHIAATSGTFEAHRSDEPHLNAAELRLANRRVAARGALPQQNGNANGDEALLDLKSFQQ